MASLRDDASAAYKAVQSGRERAQAHTSQESWTPSAVPALWSKA